jgi:glycosyltransferase involved in cell wall biosynthesis
MTKPHIVNACFVGSLGLADYTLSLARALSAHARSTIVTACTFDYPSVPHACEVVRLFRRSRHYPVDLWRFLVWVWRTRPDVLVLQAPLKLPVLDAIVVRLLRLSGVRVATTVHDVLPHYPNAWSPLVYRFFYRSFDRLIAHSETARERLVELGARAPILVVPHGVYDLYRLSDPGRQEARQRIGGLGEKDFVVLFFGQVDERKGIAELLDVAEQLGADSPVKFLISGATKFALANDQLRERFQRARTWPNCRIVDKRIPFDEVEHHFAAADAVVLPYLEGTTSGVLKLAMAFGKPVVATDVGDMPETVPAEAGIVISSRNVRDELAPAIERLRSNYDAYRQHWTEVGDRYAWKAIAARYHEFLTSDLAQQA